MALSRKPTMTLRRVEARWTFIWTTFWGPDDPPAILQEEKMSHDTATHTSYEKFKKTLGFIAPCMYVVTGKTIQQ